MVMRNVIGRSGEEKVVDLLKELQRKASESNTTPAGNKVLSSGEDFYWQRPDGSEHSMREIDAELEGARGRIDEAEQSLADSQVRLDEAEQIVEEARARLDSVQSVILLSHGDGRQGRADASEAWGFDTTDAPPGAEGSWSVTAAQNSGYPLFPGVEERWAIPVDPAREYLITYWTKNSAAGGLHAGQATRYDAGGAALGTFFLSTNRASGTEWTKHELTITPAQLNGAARLGFAMYGNVGANRGSFKTGGWSLQAKVGARQVEASEELSTLVVTDSAILNHATLIGQTVVDDINVQGKLIGTDGVFTGTVDFENINVTGGAIVEKLSGNTLSGVTVTAGSIDGSRTMTLRDNVLFGQPGIEFNSAIAGATAPPVILGYGEEGEDTSATMKGAVTVRSAFGLAAGNSQLTVAPASVRMARWSNPTASADGLHSRAYAQTDQAGLGVSRTSRLSGDITSSSYVTARQSDVFMGFTSFGNQSYLQVSSSGPRFVRSTTGSPTITAPLAPDIVPFDTNAWWDTAGSPTHGIIVTHSLAGRHCRARLRLRRVGETFNVTTSFQEFGGQPIPPNLRTSMTDYIDVRFPATSNNDSGVLFINYATSQMQIRTRGGTIPMPNGAIMYADLEWFIPN